jgi:hypothetical protein
VTTSTLTRERQQLLTDLIGQLPKTRGPLRPQTERAIRRLEVELAGGRGIAGRAATR